MHLLQDSQKTVEKVRKLKLKKKKPVETVNSSTASDKNAIATHHDDGSFNNASALGTVAQTATPHSSVDTSTANNKNEGNENNIPSKEVIRNTISTTVTKVIPKLPSHDEVTTSSWEDNVVSSPVTLGLDESQNVGLESQVEQANEDRRGTTPSSSVAAGDTASNGPDNQVAMEVDDPDANSDNAVPSDAFDKMDGSVDGESAMDDDNEDSRRKLNIVLQDLESPSKDSFSSEEDNTTDNFTRAEGVAAVLDSTGGDSLLNATDSNAKVIKVSIKSLIEEESVKIKSPVKSHPSIRATKASDSSVCSTHNSNESADKVNSNPLIVPVSLEDVGTEKFSSAGDDQLNFTNIIQRVENESKLRLHEKGHTSKPVTSPTVGKSLPETAASEGDNSLTLPRPSSKTNVASLDLKKLEVLDDGENNMMNILSEAAMLVREQLEQSNKKETNDGSTTKVPSDVLYNTEGAKNSQVATSESSVTTEEIVQPQVIKCTETFDSTVQNKADTESLVEPMDVEEVSSYRTEQNEDKSENLPRSSLDYELLTRNVSRMSSQKDIISGNDVKHSASGTKPVGECHEEYIQSDSGDLNNSCARYTEQPRLHVSAESTRITSILDDTSIMETEEDSENAICKETGSAKVKAMNTELQKTNDDSRQSLIDKLELRSKSCDEKEMDQEDQEMTAGENSCNSVSSNTFDNAGVISGSRDSDTTVKSFSKSEKIIDHAELAADRDAKKPLISEDIHEEAIDVDESLLPASRVTISDEGSEKIPTGLSKDCCVEGSKIQRRENVKMQPKESSSVEDSREQQEVCFKQQIRFHRNEILSEESDAISTEKSAAISSEKSDAISSKKFEMLSSEASEMIPQSKIRSNEESKMHFTKQSGEISNNDSKGPFTDETEVKSVLQSEDELMKEPENLMREQPEDMLKGKSESTEKDQLANKERRKTESMSTEVLEDVPTKEEINNKQPNNPVIDIHNSETSGDELTNDRNNLYGVSSDIYSSDFQNPPAKSSPVHAQHDSSDDESDDSSSSSSSSSSEHDTSSVKDADQSQKSADISHNSDISMSTIDDHSKHDDSHSVDSEPASDTEIAQNDGACDDVSPQPACNTTPDNDEGEEYTDEEILTPMSKRKYSIVTKLFPETSQISVERIIYSSH